MWGIWRQTGTTGGVAIEGAWRATSFVEKQGFMACQRSLSLSSCLHSRCSVWQFIHGHLGVGAFGSSYVVLYASWPKALTWTSIPLWRLHKCFLLLFVGGAFLHRLVRRLIPGIEATGPLPEPGWFPVAPRPTPLALAAQSMPDLPESAPV